MHLTGGWLLLVLLFSGLLQFPMKLPKGFHFLQREWSKTLKLDLFGWQAEAWGLLSVWFQTLC